MHIEVFEDPAVSQLEPITLGRAAYSIQCGSYCLADWLTRQNCSIRGNVRTYLKSWQAAEYPRFASAAANSVWRLLVNARLVPCRASFATLDKLVHSNRPGLVRNGENLVAAVLPPEGAELPEPWEAGHIASWLRIPSIAALPALEYHLPLFSYPHDLVSKHVERITDNLEHRIHTGTYREVRDGVFLAGNAELAEWAHTDTAQGPIVLDAASCVRPFACLRGPLYLGPMSIINEHASIKPGVAIGPMSKVGGEVEASVIEGFSNKQHLGYLGHSYLGRWVNLGAGTSNSNLKNTYGTVRLEVGGRRVDTGLQFMGCVIGDYTKSAINTAIFTGKLVGACSMLYGYVTENVPSFVNYATSFGEITEIPPDVMAQTQKRVFLRRGIEQQLWHVQLLRDMYEQVAEGRQLADRPVTL